jgi:hypothetical protein
MPVPWIPVPEWRPDGEGRAFWSPKFEGMLLGYRFWNLVLRYDHSFLSRLDGRCYHVCEVVAHGKYVAPRLGSVISLPDGTDLEILESTTTPE